MYAIMIVEDEELIRQGLTSLVDYEQFGMTVINQAKNGREAWEKFQDQPADILLTDINMPQMNGLDLAHLVKEQSPSCHIIFLTGYDDFEFARKAIKLGADDYLLKPFSFAEFLVAAQKALHWFEMKNGAVSTKKAIEKTGIFVKSEYKLIHLLFDDIIYIEGLKDYVKIYTQNDSKPILSLMSLKSLEEELPAASFMRVHRSFIIRKNKIENIHKYRIRIAGRDIPIGETYRHKLDTLVGRKED